jgi:hypothetical protein
VPVDDDHPVAAVLALEPSPASVEPALREMSVEPALREMGVPRQSEPGHLTPL